MKYKSGEIDIWMIITIVLGVLFLAAGSLGILAYVNYSDQKNNVDSKVSEAVAIAKKEQADEDEKKFAEREKETRRDFVGPEDYGRLTLKYPKTWSVYEQSNAAKGGNYEAIMNPIVVPMISNVQSYAFRVTIQEKDFDTVNKTFEPAVKRGDLTMSPMATVGVTDTTGIRYDGAISKDKRGSVVVFKLRDKTVIVQTDAETFKPDFDAIIKTIDFNK